jgi:hypothetical protein
MYSDSVQDIFYNNLYDIDTGEADNEQVMPRLPDGFAFAQYIVKCVCEQPQQYG